MNALAGLRRAILVLRRAAAPMAGLLAAGGLVPGGAVFAANPQTSPAGVTGDAKPDFLYDPTTGDVRFSYDGVPLVNRSGAASYLDSLNMSSASGLLLFNNPPSNFKNGVGATLIPTTIASFLFNSPGFPDGYDLGRVLPAQLTPANLQNDLILIYQIFGAAQKRSDIIFTTTSPLPSTYNGPSGTWGTDANWMQGRGPHLGDTVLFSQTSVGPLNVTYNNTVAGGGTAVTLLTVDGTNGSAVTLSQTENTLNVEGTMFVGYSGTGVAVLSGGTQTVGGFIVLGQGTGSSGNYSVTGGTLRNVSGIRVGENGTGIFNQSGGSVIANSNLTIGDVVGSSGTYNISNGASLTVLATLSIGPHGTGLLNQTGGSIVAQTISGATFNLSGSSIVSAGSESLGTLNQTGGIHTITAGASFGAGILSGTARLSVGGIESWGAFSQTGGSNAAGGGLSVIGAASLSGSANLYVGGSESASIDSNGGSITQSGGSNIVAGNLNVGVGIGAAAGAFNQSGGTTSIGGGLNLTIGTVKITGGSFSVAAASAIQLAGTLTFQGGTVSLAGVTNLGTVNFNSGPVTMASLNNSKTVNVLGGSLITGPVQNYGGLSITSGGIAADRIDNNAGAALVWSGGTITTNTFNNSGLLVVTGGGMRQLGGNFLNTNTGFIQTIGTGLSFTGVATNQGVILTEGISSPIGGGVLSGSTVTFQAIGTTSLKAMDAAYPLDFNVTAGTLRITGALAGVHSISVTNIGSIQLSSGTDRAPLPVLPVSIEGAGRINIQSADLLIAISATGTAPTNVASWIKSGYAGGTWSGTGIVSSLAAFDPGHYAVGSVAGGLGIAGIPAGQMLVRAAPLGDVSLSGAVTQDSIQQIIARGHFNDGTASNTWIDGDMNYDGTVNNTDIRLIALSGNYATSSGSSLTIEPAAAVSLASGVPAYTYNSFTGDVRLVANGATNIVDLHLLSSGLVSTNSTFTSFVTATSSELESTLFGSTFGDDYDLGNILPLGLSQSTLNATGTWRYSLSGGLSEQPTAITAVPEPASSAAVLGGASILFLRRRKTVSRASRPCFR